MLNKKESQQQRKKIYCIPLGCVGVAAIQFSVHCNLNAFAIYSVVNKNQLYQIPNR